jgi:hypothetical protein
MKSYLVIIMAAVLLFACTSGYEVSSRSVGIEPSDLVCVRRIYLGEDTHPGMPHMPRDEKTVARVERRIRRDIPDLIMVDRAEEADVIVSVLFAPPHACSHCDPEPDAEWMAIVEHGGTQHRQNYTTVGPFLELSGRVREGFDPTWGFVKQLRELIRNGRCRSAG